MDNKITKSRLSAFLHYEWLKIVGLVAAVIGVLCLVFMGIGTDTNILSKGQTLYIHYEGTILGQDDLENFARSSKSGVSYEVQEVSTASLDASSGSQQIITWASAGNVDVVICTKDAIKKVTLMTAVENYDNYCVKALNYAKTFLKDGVTVAENASYYDLKNVLVDDNISLSKVEESFNNRHDDNRFKRSSEKQVGIGFEKERISELFNSVKCLKYLLEFHPKCFYSLTDVASTPEIEGDKVAFHLGSLVAKEGGDITEYASRRIYKDNGEEIITAQDLVYSIFDIEPSQPTLHYESLSLLVGLVNECSALLDGVYNF